MHDLIKLIDVVIWPLTIILILYWFKRPLQAVFGRLNKLDASASGISLSFSEKLEQAKQKAISLSQSEGKSKSGPGIQPKIESENLRKVKAQEAEIRAILAEKADKVNISSSGLGLRDLSKKLKEKGQLQYEKAELIDMFSDLASSANENITTSQFNDITLIYETIKNQ